MNRASSIGTRSASDCRKRRRSLAQQKLRASAASADVCRVFGVFFAVLVRLVLASFSLFTVWLVVTQLGEIRYWALASPNLFLVLELLITVITRAGQERKWICLCFVFYLMSSVPSVWLLELDRLQKFGSSHSNRSSLKISVSELHTVIEVNASMALNITEQCLVFLLIFCRWLLPRGDITRDMLSQLLFVFIGMASDVMELFQLFSEPKVRSDTPLTYVILAIWTLSLFQFTFVMIMSQNPKTAVHSDQDDNESGQVTNEQIHSEVWSLVTAIAMQDGPFLILRLYILFNFNLLNYTIIFFTCKNGLVLLLLAYRFVVIGLRRWEGSDEDDVDGRVQRENADNHNRTCRKIAPIAE